MNLTVLTTVSLVMIIEYSKTKIYILHKIYNFTQNLHFYTNFPILYIFLIVTLV